MKYHVLGWEMLFVTIDWVPKVNLLHFGRLQGSTQAFFATNWQDKPGICYRMGIYVSRKRIVSGPSARKCPLQDGRTLNRICTSIHPNSDSSQRKNALMENAFLPMAMHVDALPSNTFPKHTHLIDALSSAYSN